MTVLGSVQEGLDRLPKIETPPQRIKKSLALPRSFVIAPEDASAVVAAIISAIASKTISTLTSIVTTSVKWAKKRVITLLSGLYGLGFSLKVFLFEEPVIFKTLQNVRFGDRKKVFEDAQPIFTSATTDGEKIAEILKTAAHVMAQSEGVEKLIAPFQTCKVWTDATDCNLNCKIGHRPSMNQIQIVKDVLCDVKQTKKYGFAVFAATKTYLEVDPPAYLAVVEKKVVVVQKTRNHLLDTIAGFTLQGKREQELVKIHRSLGKKMFDILNCFGMSHEEERLRNGLALSMRERFVRRKFRIR